MNKKIGIYRLDKTHYLCSNAESGLRSIPKAFMGIDSSRALNPICATLIEAKNIKIE